MGTLYLITTPIGNLEDITIRALKMLFNVDYLACEDSRRTGILFQELQKRFTHILDSNKLKVPKFISYYDEIEHKRTPEIIELLKNDFNVGLISDAGTPLVSDPGYQLVKAAKQRGYNVISIPGVSAAITALTTSGLSLDHFFFLGYAPEKEQSRINFLLKIKSCHDSLPATYILYCAPHKLITTLNDILKTLGDITIVVAHELTKIHESVWTGKVSEAIEKNVQIKGEIVLLFRLDHE